MKAGLLFLRKSAMVLKSGLSRLKIDDPDEVIFGDQFFQRDRKQTGLAAGLLLDERRGPRAAVSRPGMSVRDPVGGTSAGSAQKGLPQGDG
jgi:hypothetical protein